MPKLDQTAFYCSTEKAELYVKRMFGLEHEPWVKDTVTAMSSVFGAEPARNIADLQFNYSLGHELEILHYREGPNWHQKTMMREPFISHVGLHLGDDEDFPNTDFAGNQLLRLVQETKTISHTSEYLTTGAGTGRLYHYRIYEVAPGSYVKYIKRVRDNEKGFKT